MPIICIVGLGYIGLPTAVIFARNGFNVVGVDIDSTIVEKINKGEAHISEPELDKELKTVLKRNLFIAQTIPVEADFFIICVPTPHYLGENGIFHPDTSLVFRAIKSISSFLKKDNLVILESTSPVGTTENIFSILSKNTNLKDEEINIAYCPERVLPGNILSELVNNDRVLGGLTVSATEKAKDLYSKICNGTISTTNAKTAELVKLSENAFRDVNIAFANELSMVCDEVDIDVMDLIKLANRHPRVNILNPGCGVGGHCIAIDPWFIASRFPEVTPLIRKAREVNTNKTKWVINKIKNIAKVFKNKNKFNPSIGFLGLTYKPDVDDLRESPSLGIVQKLVFENNKVLVAEPNISEFKGINILPLEVVLEESDLVFILVAHKEFRSLNCNSQRIFDFTGFY